MTAIRKTRQFCIYALVTVFFLDALTPSVAVVAAPYSKPAKLLKQATQECLPHLTSDKAPTPAYVRCIATALGLWTDAEGYNAKRVASFFKKYRLPEEVRVVADYCNQRYRQEDLDSWAYDAYRCASVGQMGSWVQDYMSRSQAEES